MKQHQAHPHTPRAIKSLPWRVCSGCGLVFLRNALTEWCVRHGCNHTEHPGYRNAVATLSRPEAT